MEVWIFAHSDYNEFSIIGVYASQTKAELVRWMYLERNRVNKNDWRYYSIESWTVE